MRHFIAAGMLALFFTVAFSCGRAQDTPSVVGIGAVLAGDGPHLGNLDNRIIDHIIVRQVVPGGPAAKGGLRVGDEIVQVDDKRVAGLNFHYVVEHLIRGEEGSRVKIVARHKGSASPVSFILTREPILPNLPEHGE